MVFSDNVPLEQEVALKEYAGRAGLLVMGPDCGTAVVGGVGLGFANVVRPGPVGIVAASGTGAQHLMALLDGAGVGVSHCLGVGGRDLSAEVAGRSTLQALDLLDADDGHRAGRGRLQAAGRRGRRGRARPGRGLGTPVLFGLLGAGQPDLTATAAVGRARPPAGRWAAPEHWAGEVATGRPGGALRGLFVGGTLCDEAMLVASAALGRVTSNIPLDPSWAVGDDLASDGHTMLDFGDDRLTRGRPHPMIDGALRVERLLAETEDPTTGVLLLDVVLGLGSADDPAAELVPRPARGPGRRRPRRGLGDRDPRRPPGPARAGRGAARRRRLGAPVQRGRRPVRPRPARRPRREPLDSPGRRHRRRLPARRRPAAAGRRRLRGAVAAARRRPRRPWPR